MLRLLLTIILFFSFAALSQAQEEHEKSAIMFADRGDWDNARAHAKATEDNAFIKLIDWEYLLDDSSGAGFDEYKNFIAENPTWPEQKKLRLRAEMALRTGTVGDADILEWFEGNTPMTGVGKVALAEALSRTKTAPSDKISTLIHDAWKNGDFDESQEKKLLVDYGNMLTRDDHIARIDRLLWDERLVAAGRIMKLVPENYQKLFKARIGLIEDRKLAVLFVVQVPSALKNNPGLIYDRMRYRARRGDDKGVREMLLLAPAQVPYPDKWWKTRETQIRAAIGEKNIKLAEKLLANHGQIEARDLSEALWLQGWLNSEYLGQPKEGYKEFKALYEKVHYPVSKARAAYWAGRAAEEMGEKSNAESWYDHAGDYPTTFYGQLGLLKHNGKTALSLPSAPSINSEERERFAHSDLVRAINFALALGEKDLASRMISWIAENSESEPDVALAAELGDKAGQPYLGVRAAKKALQHNVVLVDAGYPLPKKPDSTPIERPLTLAISRQESEFNPTARSPAGAMGMMQLLPKSAKEVAKKNDITFSADRLNDPDYNMMLGSLYLLRLINAYDGSYVMGIAAYNAGPGNVRDWVKQFGTPGNNLDEAVNWIEKIPFHETRNYVQRVLENLQVYRHLEADGDTDKFGLGEDLVR